jgi:hypothetical protein
MGTWKIKPSLNRLYNNLYLRTAYVVVRNNLCISCVFIEELHIKAHGE